MAEKASSDIFMFFEENGNRLPGESSTVLTVPGKARHELLNSFEPKFMFEITEFSFGVGTNAGEDDGIPPELKKALKAQPDFKYPTSFARQKAKPGATKLEDTPVTVHPVEFSRTMDTASSLLLHHTIQRTYFKRVALVKRKSAGGAAAGEPYLRMDFRGVILTEANWSNEDPIKEQYTFEARSITMRYRPQLENGKLGASRIGFWSMVPNEKEATL